MFVGMSKEIYDKEDKSKPQALHGTNYPPQTLQFDMYK